MRSGVLRSSIFFFTRVDFYVGFFLRSLRGLRWEDCGVSLRLDVDLGRDVFLDFVTDFDYDLVRLLLVDFLCLGVGYLSRCMFKFVKAKYLNSNKYLVSSNQSVTIIIKFVL